MYDSTHTRNAIVNVEEVHTVYARDIYGNQQINQVDVFTVTVASTDNTFSGTVTPIADATYEIRYTISVAGEYTLEIRVQPGGSGPTYPITDSGLPVTVSVNEVDAS